MIDLSRERSLTPGCADQVFLDSAGSSLPPTPVVEEVVAHVRREAQVGGYRAAAERAEDLAALPGTIGRLIGCRADEVALSDSATRAWSSFVTALRWTPGDRVLVCGNEYASNAIALLQRARFDGCSVEVVPDGPEGGVDLLALERMLDERVRLVSVVHVATNSGRVAPVAEITALAQASGALVLLDACQSVGQLALDVTALGVDALTATGRKWLRAPRGTGFLFVRSGLAAELEPAAADLRGATWTAPDRYDLHDGAARFELWESDVAGRLGLKVALDHLLALGIEEVEAAVRSSAATLRDGFAGIPGVRLHDQGPDLAGIVSLTLDGIAPESVKDQLLGLGVTVSVSGAGSTRLDMEARGLDAVVRASPHYFVSPEDLDAALIAVAKVAGAGG